MKTFIKTGLILVLLLGTSFSSLAQNPVNIILMAGQSNMAGAGHYGALSPSIIERINRIKSRVSISTNGEIPIPIGFTLSPHHLKKYGFAETFGPELFMALTLAEANPTQSYLFVKTASGGTSLYGAWNPNWTAEKAKASEKPHKQKLKLFEQHIIQVNQQLEELTLKNTPYKILALGWLQGENDAAREMRAVNYQHNLEALFSAYRQNLNQPNLPIIVGQINSTYGNFTQGPALVRNAQKDVTLNDPNSYLVATSTNPKWMDYPKHPDNVHYNTAGQINLGKAFGNILNTVAKETKNLTIQE
jgi:hypothetical protein